MFSPSSNVCRESRPLSNLEEMVCSLLLLKLRLFSWDKELNTAFAGDTKLSESPLPFRSLQTEQQWSLLYSAAQGEQGSGWSLTTVVMNGPLTNLVTNRIASVRFNWGPDDNHLRAMANLATKIYKFSPSHQVLLMVSTVNWYIQSSGK